MRDALGTQAPASSIEAATDHLELWGRVGPLVAHEAQVFQLLDEGLQHSLCHLWRACDDVPVVDVRRHETAVRCEGRAASAVSHQLRFQAEASLRA